MKIQKIVIHNFRSIKEEEIVLDDYSLLIGPNNCGKSNVIDAIRVFYEKDGVKFLKSDEPKFETDDLDSWIDIEYRTTDEEYESLKDSYRLGENIFRVRKWIRSSDSSIKPGIYGYENGVLSHTLFYGAKNIQQAKLGEVVYIPAVSRLDEHTKLSGPSALRDLLNYVLSKVLEKSPAYESLKTAFSEFNAVFPKEKSVDEVSIEQLKNDIDQDLSDWGSKFEVIVNPVTPQEILKYLIDHRILDTSINQPMPSSSFGHGFQRQLIFTLIKLAAKYRDSKGSAGKKEFQPDFSLILFEEPEAFLHPPQQIILSESLQDIALEENEQVLISTHSSLFVSKNIDDLTCIIKLQREEAESRVYQLTLPEKERLFQNNQVVNNISPTPFSELESESLRYMLWLNSERASLFFAKVVLIVEGPTEKALIEYLIKNKKIDVREKQLYILDAFGKFNICRFMNLLGEFGLHHGVLFDDDSGNDGQKAFNDLITSSGNKFTLGIGSFGVDFETFLGITVPQGRESQKPLNALCKYTSGAISHEAIKNLNERIVSILFPN